MSEFAAHIPDDMDFDLAQEWGDNLHKVMPVILRNFKPWDVLAAFEASKPLLAIPPYPAVGDEFDLTIAKPLTGLDIVTRFGYDQKGWKFNGKEVKGPQTKKFKLVSIGAQPNFEAVKAALVKHGMIPEGQWCAAFKKAFPQPDGNGSIGVADASWVDPHGSAYFPYVYTDGDLYFRWIDYDFFAFWRWLVEVQAKA